MKSKNKELKSIKVQSETYERLVNASRKKETFDDTIRRKLDEAENCSVMYED